MESQIEKEKLFKNEIDRKNKINSNKSKLLDQDFQKGKNEQFENFGVK